MDNPLQKAVDIAGSQSALARAIGKRQGHIWEWLNNAKRGVPAEYCEAIERATNGAVTRHALRPDIFGPPPAKSKRAPVPSQEAAV